tara:strand:- start:1284 stop:2564 length:1281 start_codon:yes stop_codon:yes gene_type:complete
MITYSSALTYFKTFADKHLQINSFSYGSLDQLDLKKINEFPALHIILTNTDISDKVVNYDFDVYVFSAVDQQSEEDEQVKESAYTDSLMVLQDLRAEFTEGKYIVDTNKLLLQGSNELSCTPIEERFNNMVVGFSTSISLEAANETTECTIPYQKHNGENIQETWNNIAVTLPEMNDFSQKFYWWSGTESVQNSLNYVGNGISRITPFFKPVQSLFNDDYLYNSQGILPNPIRYNSSYRGIEFNGNKETYNLALQYTIASQGALGYQSYHCLKLKHIVDTGDAENHIFSITSPSPTAAGYSFFVTGSSHAEPNCLCYRHIQSGVTTTIANISDGSNDYTREGSITMGIAVLGVAMLTDDLTISIYIDGVKLSTTVISTDPFVYVWIGNPNTEESKFILQEYYTNLILNTTSKESDFPKLNHWIKNR